MWRGEHAFEVFDALDEGLECPVEGVVFVDPFLDGLDDRGWRVCQVLPALGGVHPGLPFEECGTRLNQDGGQVCRACDAELEFDRIPESAWGFVSRHEGVDIFGQRFDRFFDVVVRIAYAAAAKNGQKDSQ